MRPLLALMMCTPVFGEEILKNPGLNHFYNLEYDEALAIFERDLAAKPSAGMHNRIAQAIVFREMFRTGALESELVSGSNPFLRREKLNPSPEAQARFDSAINSAMSLAGTSLKQNSKDVAALYDLGVAYGLRANYGFLVRKSWRDALRDVTTARKLHNQATEIDPGFVDARLIQGVYDYVVGSLPLTWKMLAFIAGFRGDRDRGIQTLKLVAERGRNNRLDAQIFLIALYRRERRAAEAVPLLENLVELLPRNFLPRLELAYMYGDLGQRAKALAVLDRIDEFKRAGGYGRLHPAKVHFARGNLLFWFDDYERAAAELESATPYAADLDLNTALLAWMRLGQVRDLRGERKSAVAAYLEVLKLAPESEIAKEARRYISSRYKR
jgi:tetratricopeptide (TPR) repeat protein